MSTLIYHSGGLGDFLTALPAVRAWRLGHPQESAVLLGKPSHGTVACCSGYFDEVWDVGSASHAWLFGTETAVSENTRSMFSQFTAAVLFASPDSPIANRLSSAGVRKLYSQAPFPESRTPAALYHLSLFPGLTRLLDHFGPIIRSDPGYRKDALDLLEGVDDYIIIHPGSGSRIKNWPFEHFNAVARECRCRGFKIVWIYGEAEIDLPTPTGDLVVRNALLPVVVHLLEMSSAYIGNDSGISHLAAATGCRSIILFGPSDDAVWAPPGAHVTIVKARRACDSCHPFRDGCRRCTDSCMRRISVEEVFETFMRTMGSRCIKLATPALYYNEC
jgi:heptosyltransferase III